MPPIPRAERNWAISLHDTMTPQASGAINDYLKQINGITEPGPAPTGVPGRILAFNHLVAWGFLIQTPDKKIDSIEPSMTHEANLYLVDQLRQSFALKNYGHLTRDSSYSRIERVVSIPIRKVMEFREGATSLLLELGGFFINERGLIDVKPELIIDPKDLQPVGSDVGPVHQDA